MPRRIPCLASSRDSRHSLIGPAREGDGAVSAAAREPFRQPRGAEAGTRTDRAPSPAFSQQGGKHSHFFRKGITPRTWVGKGLLPGDRGSRPRPPPGRSIFEKEVNTPSRAATRQTPNGCLCGRGQGAESDNDLLTIREPLRYPQTVGKCMLPHRRTADAAAPRTPWSSAHVDDRAGGRTGSGHPTRG